MNTYANETMDSLNNKNSKKLIDVTITGNLRALSQLESTNNTELYRNTFFKRTATQNLFEGIGMMNGINNQINCSVCGTGDIHINGLEGPYTTVLIDNMPIVSSLSTVYGLLAIPESIIKRVEVVKGASSTLFGSEAIGGIINIITKDPSFLNPATINVNVSTYQEYNTDLTYSIYKEKYSTLFAFNSFWFNTLYDINNDNFTDIPIQNRVSLFNKWKIRLSPNNDLSVATRFLHEDRWGGELQWNRNFLGSDVVYGEFISTQRFELIAKTTISIFNQKVITNFSYNAHNQDSYYGQTKFFADQHTFFIQGYVEKKIKNHVLLVGVPIRYIFYDDNTILTDKKDNDDNKIGNSPQINFSPAIFMQDEWNINSKTTLLGGVRFEHYKNHPLIFSPRFGINYRIGENTALKFNVGNGFRIVNLFTEEHAALSGSREVVVNETIKPERSWNGNISFVSKHYADNLSISLDGTIFYTYFFNKIIPDFDTDPNQIIYENTSEYAISRGITINSYIHFYNGLSVSIGSTLSDVFQIIANEQGELSKSQQVFNSPFTLNYFVRYAIPKIKVSVNLTGKLFSPMRLPIVENDFRSEFSPWFTNMNIRISKKIKNLEIYIAIKNLLHFYERNPLLRPFDPFDKNIEINNPNGYTFDTEYNYIALQGIRGLFGVQLTLKRKK